MTTPDRLTDKQCDAIDECVVNTLPIAFTDQQYVHSLIRAGQAAASVPRGEPVAWYTPLIGNYAHVVWGKRPDTPMEWAPLYAAPAVAQDKEKP